MRTILIASIAVLSIAALSLLGQKRTFSDAEVLRVHRAALLIDTHNDVPWRVVDSVRTIRGTVEEHLASLGMPRFSEVERGRRLFAAQGCVNCHVHRDVPITGQMSAVGPELSDLRLPAEYLARFLANPSVKPKSAGRMQMPDLALREKEILPLVAFLTAERRAASK